MWGKRRCACWRRQFSIFNLGKLIKFFPKITLEELQRIEGIGEVVGKSIYDWFKDKNNVEFLEILRDGGVTLSKKSEVRSQKLRGKVFVLTGTMAGLTREEAKDKIRELGGDVSASVSKNTDYVVAGSEPGSKYDKAKKLGVKIIDEKKFLEMLK